MSAKDAGEFFLKPESYCTLDLPPYFDFEPVLQEVKNYLEKNSLNINTLKPRNFEDVNYTIYSNKDGRYAWRPIQLIHPVLYVDLVNIMTEPEAWEKIQSRFGEFSNNPKIRCLSIPQKSLIKRKNQAAQILHWWQGIEQASIENALDFNYVLHTDIADCYPSIYTHSIAWAMHGKQEAKTNRGPSLLGNKIDARLQDMQHGQTNGIPQGSVLMDLIAELVLGYADLELGKRLDKAKLSDFQILRYRDDYRIFTNDSQIGEKILKILTEVLLELGLKLNASKTMTMDAQGVISSAIKNDKIAWLRGKQWDRNLQKHLLLIHCHGTDYPNAGSLVDALDKFYRRLLRLTKVQNPLQLISIATDIGYRNPRCFPACAAIISKLLSLLSTKEERLKALKRIRHRLTQLPNNGYLEIWLQRISYPFDPKISYREKLCSLVKGEVVDLWNNKWITDHTLIAKVDPKNIVNKTRLESLQAIVKRAEFIVFSGY